jgi:transcriptional regulator with XRE-family HTH domain
MAGRPNNPHVAKFQAALRAAVAASDHSQNEVAEICGIDRGTMSKIVNGTRGIPSEEKVECLDRVLGADGHIIALGGYRGEAPPTRDQINKLLEWHYRAALKEMTKQYKAANEEILTLYPPSRKRP